MSLTEVAMLVAEFHSDEVSKETVATSHRQWHGHEYGVMKIAPAWGRDHSRAPQFSIRYFCEATTIALHYERDGR